MIVSPDTWSFLWFRCYFSLFWVPCSFHCPSATAPHPPIPPAGKHLCCCAPAEQGQCVRLPTQRPGVLPSRCYYLCHIKERLKSRVAYPKGLILHRALGGGQIPILFYISKGLYMKKQNTEGEVSKFTILEYMAMKKNLQNWEIRVKKKRENWANLHPEWGHRPYPCLILSTVFIWKGIIDVEKLPNSSPMYYVTFLIFW
jgi:hypothetical protein